MTRRYMIVFALLLVALCTPPLARASGQTPINSYTADYIGNGLALGVNDAGQVTGVSGGRAFLWDGGLMTDLGTLGGWEAIGYAINNSGQVAGRSTIASGYTRAFLWDAAAGIRDLGTLGGEYSAATGINDAGQVVGWAHKTVAEAPSYDSQTRAFLWQNGQMYDLGTLPGGTYSAAYGINASGQVVGYAGDGTTVRAFLWTPTVPNGTAGTMVALPSFASSWASGVNTSGEAVGEIAEAPYRWDSAGAHALPQEGFPQDPWGSWGIGGGSGTAINDSQQVAGYSWYWWWEGRIPTATVWDSVSGGRLLGDLAGLWLDEATAINSSGQIAANGSGQAFLVTPSPLPVGPSGLWATPGDGRVELGWEASYGAVSPTSYTVKRSTSGGPYDVIATGLAGTTFADTAVVNGTRYTYVVSAVNAYGSADSNQAAAIPVALPAAPAGLTATAGYWQVSLSWNASAGADYYYVYRSTTSGGPYHFIAGVLETSVLDDNGGWGLDPGTTYHYVVTGINAAGASPYSNEASATPTVPPPPPAPTGLTAVPGDKQVTLAWNASPGTDYYTVKYASQSGGPYTVWGGVLDASMTVAGLMNGQTYYFVVSAVNSGGESPNSNEASAAPNGPPPPPPPAAPTNLTATAGKKKGTIALKWKQSASSGVTQNRVYRSTTSGGPYALIANLKATTSFSNTSLTSGATYYYVVTAVNSSGKESAFSNQAPARPR